MKLLGVLVLFGLIGAAIFTGLRGEKKPPAVPGDRVTLLMTMDDVQGRLGEPIARAVDGHGSEYWVYGDRTVRFSRSGKVIDVEASRAPERDLASVGPESSAEGKDGRRGQRVTSPRLGGGSNVRTLQPGVSYEQSRGMGGGPGPWPTATPTAAEARRAEMGLKGSALDRAAR